MFITRAQSVLSFINPPLYETLVTNPPLYETLVQEFSILCPAAAELTRDCKYLTSEASRCWLFVDDAQVTWTAAAQLCAGVGGKLATEEDSAVRDALVKEMARRSSVSRWWTGLRLSALDRWRTLTDQILAPNEGKSY